MTSKLQVTIPKALAERYGVQAGDEIAWEPAGDVIRVVPSGRKTAPDREARLRFFDQATVRQRRRKAPLSGTAGEASRGWTREELYERGRTR